MCTMGHVTADSRRLSGSGHCGSRTARRVSGLTRHGHDVRVRPVKPVEKLAAVRRGAEREHRAAVAVPRADERFADALAATLGRDHRIAAPRAFDFDPLDRHADRQRRVVTDDRRPFARHPDLRLRRSGCTGCVDAASPSEAAARWRRRRRACVGKGYLRRDGRPA